MDDVTFASDSGQSGSQCHSCGGLTKKIQTVAHAKSLPTCLAVGANARMRWGEWKAGREL